MSAGVTYNRTITKPCQIQPNTRYEFSITLTQGMNRQIRRMCKALGYRVTHLQRIRMVNLLLASLPLNHFRPLHTNELNQLKACLNFIAQ